jgi:hypothetical protein
MNSNQNNNLLCLNTDPGVDGRIILRWIFRKWDVGEGVWTGLGWIRIETDGGHL